MQKIVFTRLERGIFASNIQTEIFTNNGVKHAALDFIDRVVYLL